MVKSFVIETSLGKPTVTVPFALLTSISFKVPETNKTAPVVASFKDITPEESEKSPLSKVAKPLFVPLACASATLIVIVLSVTAVVIGVLPPYYG